MDSIPFFLYCQLSALLSDRGIIAAGHGIDSGRGRGSSGGVRVGLGLGRILELFFEFVNTLSQSLNLSIGRGC